MDSHNKIIQQVANDVFSPMGFNCCGTDINLVLNFHALMLIYQA